jgi:transposase
MLSKGVADGTQELFARVQAELRRLREENRRLLMEREILKKAAAFFAKESP